MVTDIGTALAGLWRGGEGPWKEGAHAYILVALKVVTYVF